MPGTNTSQQDEYSSWVGLIYVFNLIVGTGALTLPSVFAKAGWLLSSLLIIFLAFVSFITVTFVIETMAVANATIQLRMLESHKIDEENKTVMDSETELEELNEQMAIINGGNHSMRRYFSLNKPVEMGQMAGLYFNRTGRALFFASLCVYLYGDLSIYATAVSKSMSDLLCPNNSTSADAEFNIDCFSERIAKIHLYRACVCVFALLVCPFSYFNVQKTKYFQLATTTMRWSAFAVMITLASVRIARGGEERPTPPLLAVDGLPALIGASIYSFMCHHSLPGIIAPVADKRHVLRRLALDYGLICTFYLLLALTGVFAFRELSDLYTLNFVPSGADRQRLTLLADLLLYFLGAFPVFTLSTSFPIVAITLQNNLRTLCLDAQQQQQPHEYGVIVRRLAFPTLAIAPPIAVALSTHDLGRLVEITGAYAGACIQYIVPAMLVYRARCFCRTDIGVNVRNKYASPFQSIVWIYFVICSSLICIILVSINLFFP